MLSQLPDKIYANEGTIPVITATAFDDIDGEVEVSLNWSAGALYHGKLCIGEHTLTVSASDKTLNTTGKIITVIVRPIS